MNKLSTSLLVALTTILLVGTLPAAQAETKAESAKNAQQAPEPEDQSARMIYQGLTKQWQEHGIPTSGAKSQIGDQSFVSIPTPPVIDTRNWTNSDSLPWAAVVGDFLPDLPAIEGIRFAGNSVRFSMPMVIEVHRDQIVTWLGLDEQKRLRRIEVAPLPERGIPRVVVQFDLLAQNHPGGTNSNFLIKQDSNSESADPPLLQVTAPSSLAPRDRYRHLVSVFQSAKAIHFDATAQIRWAVDDTIHSVGNIQLQMRFAKPHHGRLTMKGWVGEEVNRRKAHSQILGSESGLMFLDAIQKTWTPVKSLEAVSNGIRGFDPLAAWAGVRLPPPLSFSMADVPGIEFGWTGLAVESKHLTSVYRFDPHDRLVEVAVARKGSLNQRQVMEYRFHGLEVLSEGAAQEYRHSLPAGYKRKVERVVDKKLNGDEQSSLITTPAESEFEKGLLAVGDLAPDLLMPQTGEGNQESLRDLRGKTTLLVFWMEASVPGQAEMQKLDKLWPRLKDRNRTAELRKIPPTLISAVQSFRVRYYPTFYLIDAEGKVAFRMVGWNAERLTSAFQQ